MKRNTRAEAARALLTSGDGRLKLECYNNECAAEPVRIALSLVKIPFDNVCVAFQDLPAKKTTMKHCAMPQMTLPDGTVVTENLAMLRLAGEADLEGKLYPQSNTMERFRIEQVLGAIAEITRAWQLAVYNPVHLQAFACGPEDERTDADATINQLCTSFVNKEMSRLIGYLKHYLQEGENNFLCGGHLTIADILAYNTIHNFQRTVADHVPNDCLEAYPEILEWMDRVDANPKVAAYKATKKM
eukprot:CAMPEP_0183765330 /NCGR_PEP_ID=MMETSP0739-20130205/10882_1 /TAXON_ID=385413 /ORGANISM="Thalassiosira miniscula, Strain CCMP1093" /LENGTH=243 /DNA_ID=CAMNT_0026003993 /DNA_START=256 /DNA_END=987 /DNA_ORIENTATION=+